MTSVGVRRQKEPQGQCRVSPSEFRSQCLSFSPLEDLGQRKVPQKLSMLDVHLEVRGTGAKVYTLTRDVDCEIVGGVS